MVGMIYDKYGKYYDLIYSTKNYDGECRGLINYFRNFAKGMVKSILDIGCGTGNHAIRFAEMGYDVVGIDISKIMIKEARRKAREKGLSVKFLVQDMRKFSLEKKFDAALCLFGTLGYCIKDNEILATFERVRKHLKSNGLFIFDFFPIHAVVKRENWRSIHEVEKNETYLIRIFDGSFNVETNVLTLKIKCKVIKGGELVDSFQEEHTIRTFTPPEIAHLLKERGLKPLSFFKINWETEIPYTLQKIDLQTANIVCIAKTA